MSLELRNKNCKDEYKLKSELKIFFNIKRHMSSLVAFE
jgi:hypothetical protein